MTDKFVVFKMIDRAVTRKIRSWETEEMVKNEIGFISIKNSKKAAKEAVRNYNLQQGGSKWRNC